MLVFVVSHGVLAFLSCLRLSLVHLAFCFFFSRAVFHDAACVVRLRTITLISLDISSLSAISSIAIVLRFVFLCFARCSVSIWDFLGLCLLFAVFSVIDC